MTDKDKKLKTLFACPIGNCIMWWKGLEYSECPLVPPHRDMLECKNCKLKIDKKWEASREAWKDLPVKKRKPKKKRNNYGPRFNSKGKK